MSNVQAIIDSLVMHYKDQLDAALLRLDRLERDIHHERAKNERLQQHVDRLRRQNVELDTHVSALREVLDGFVVRATDNVRRDLLDAFMEVAADGGPGIDELLTDEVLSDSSEDIMDIMFGNE